MSRKPKKPAPAELEAQADAILRRDETALLKQIATGVEALEACYKELIQPRNDPHYVKALEDRETQRNAIANAVDKVHIVPDGGKTWIAVGLTNPRDHAAAMETARRMGEHFEAEIIRHQGAMEGDVSHREVRQPRHAFGREKRSLPE